MPRRPHVAWPLALHLARYGDAPAATRPEALQTVAALRQAARRAGELAVEHARLPGPAATDIKVHDRPGWSRQAMVMTDTLLDRLPLEPRPDGVLRDLVGIGYGLAAGVAMSLLGRGLLGQYDPLNRRLVLLAPNLVALQRARGLVADDFFLWVACHEQTHAVQFNSAGWLLGHIAELMAAIVADDQDPGEVATDLLTGRGLMSLLVSAEAQEPLDRLVAIMTLMEGHADLVADVAGERHIPSVRRLRQAFARDHAGHGWRRLLPSLDKSAQYRDGLAFCRAVVKQTGADGLVPAFTRAELLPTLAEITRPGDWVARVHG